MTTPSACPVRRAFGLFPVPLQCHRQPAARAGSTSPNSRRMRSGGMSRVQYHRPLRERRSHDRGTSTPSVMTASMRAPWRQAWPGAGEVAEGEAMTEAE
ncbi:MAG TPA: hypothetical protein VKD72_15865 [Gemmataceae bacterium]|nr:hypothetical protein [Gemmataceae bacterium]